MGGLIKLTRVDSIFFFNITLKKNYFFNFII
jgi:hypothetical protein